MLVVWETVTLGLPPPFLVVMINAPLTPSDPYKAAACPPLRAVTLSISLELRYAIVLEGTATPSRTIKAWLLPSKERLPRRVMRGDAPTELLVLVMVKPAIL